MIRSRLTHLIASSIWMRITIFSLMGILGALGLATSAGAFFPNQNTGVGAADIAELAPPANVLATFPNPNFPSVDVTWNAPVEPDGIVLDGYFVQSFNGATTNPACGTSPTVLITTLNCTDTDAAPNTYSYLVTAVFRTWTATSAPSQPVTVPAPELTTFALSPSTPTPTAGTPFTVAITAYDQYGDVFTGYTGPECLTFSGALDSPNGTQPLYPAQGTCTTGSEVTFADGVSSGTSAPELTVYDAEPLTLSATDNPTTVTGTTPITVGPATAASFNVGNPGTQTAGQPFGDTITAYDLYGNVATGYAGSETLAFTGPSMSQSTAEPTYPTTVAFVAGVGTATGITLVDAQTTALTVTQGSITGSSGDFLVSPGPAATFDVTNPGPQTAGAQFGVTITAYDSYGNVATGYAGGEALVFSGPSNSPNTSMPTYPTSVTFAAGVGDATGIILVKAETTSLTATQDSLTGSSGDFLVSPGPAATFVVAAPPEAVVATPFSVTITAFDLYGNPATTYDGTAELVSSLSGETPVSVTLAGGADVFSATLANVGEQTITATDSVNSSVTGTSGDIDVSNAPATTYTLTYEQGAATSGTVPLDPNSPYLAGSTVKVLANTGSLAKSGYTFAGWNTAADGSGTSYAPGATFVISANTMLYPVFAAIAPTTYTVTYEQGAATSGTVPLDPSSPYVAGSTVIVLGNTGTLAETGSVFAGWNTAADGSGTSYAPGATFVISANTMLYPVFTVVKPVSYTVTYNHGAATSGSVPLDPSSPYAAGSTVIVLGNTGTLAETGSVFAGWNTAADGSGTSYAPGATFVIGANTVLYPVFTVVKPVTYTVTYDQGAATSGSVPVDVHSPYVAGTTVMVLGNSGNLAEFGYAFAGWNTAANGSGTSYAPGASFIINANIVLYPVFEKPLAITTTFLAGATAGETNYAQTLEGTGGTTPYTWSISAGSLPTGLSLNPSTGLISGTVSVTAQTVTFTVTLSDANGASTTKEFTITVCGSLSITTRFLDSAYPDEHDYAQLLEGTGGTRPYTWSISAGSLPSGLSLNPSTGLISGSVSRSATSETFTVTLSDANGASTTKQFTIEVNNRPYFICPNSGHAYSGHWFYFWAETFGSPGEQWGETGHLPKGVQFDPATGIFYGSPAPGSEGSYDITLSVENPWGSSSLSFTLDISS